MLRLQRDFKPKNSLLTLSNFTESRRHATRSETLLLER
ncbi:hypothetical protein CEXT_191801, partial [Caerostris extrusa]